MHVQIWKPLWFVVSKSNFLCYLMFLRFKRQLVICSQFYQALGMIHVLSHPWPRCLPTCSPAVLSHYWPTAHIFRIILCQFFYYSSSHLALSKCNLTLGLFYWPTKRNIITVKYSLKKEWTKSIQIIVCIIILFMCMPSPKPCFPLLVRLVGR